MFLSVDDLARETRVSKHTWRALIRRRLIASVRVGRRLLVARADLEAYMAAHRVEARPRP